LLVGIGGHRPLRPARYALIGIGATLLAFSVVQQAYTPARAAFLRADEGTRTLDLLHGKQTL
jgi:hypothetical protein